MNLRPFFSYYGAKWRVSARLPAPTREVVVEPFAGSAGYSTRHHHLAVHLVERDEVIADLWDYLIHVKASEVERLPLTLTHIDDLPPGLPTGAVSLIGFWLNHGTTAPCRKPSAWMRAGDHASSFWGEEIRHRVASQVDHIRHWTILCGDYADAPDVDATWHVDPPYSTPAGRHYRCSDVDYQHLGEWCRIRKGQVIVCEQEGATWLPFSPANDVKSTKGTSREVLWVSGS